MRHRPRLVCAYLSDGQTEPHRHLFPAAGRAGGLVQAVPQADHGGQPDRQVGEGGPEIVGRVGSRSGDGGVESSVRRVRAYSRPDGGGDPRPRVGGEPAAAARVESVDGRDQAERPGLHGLVEGVVPQAEAACAEGHEPQALADELVAGAAVSRPGGLGERAFAIRVERRLGQQVTRKGIHMISVDAALLHRRDLWRDCGQDPGWGRTSAP